MSLVGETPPSLSSMPSALAIFTCRPNSHPFQERHVYLDEPIKIGRSVARCRPAQNNATFDCKVLSRNHALVWFDHKTGKVMLLRCLTIVAFRFPWRFLRKCMQDPRVCTQTLHRGERWSLRGLQFTSPGFQSLLGVQGSEFILGKVEQS